MACPSTANSPLEAMLSFGKKGLGYTFSQWASTSVATTYKNYFHSFSPLTSL